MNDGVMPSFFLISSRLAYHLPCSGVYFQGTTIGMAPIMSMCTVEQSGGIVMVSRRPSHNPRCSLATRNLGRLTQSRCGLQRGGVSGLAFVHGHVWQNITVPNFIYFCWLSLSDFWPGSQTPAPTKK